MSYIKHALTYTIIGCVVMCMLSIVLMAAISFIFWSNYFGWEFFRWAVVIGAFKGFLETTTKLTEREKRR